MLVESHVKRRNAVAQILDASIKFGTTMHPYSGSFCNKSSLAQCKLTCDLCGLVSMTLEMEEAVEDGSRSDGPDLSQ